jgi:hypothetical protein
MNLVNLIARLETAIVGDRHTDCEIYQAMGALPPTPEAPFYWTRPDGLGRHYEAMIPRYTSSVDDALMLLPKLPPKTKVNITMENNKVFATVTARKTIIAESEAKTLAIAICMIAMIAREATKPE